MGAKGSPGGSGERPHAHVCAIFEGPDEFRVHATAFLVEGLEQGDQVAYIRADGSEGAEGLTDARFADAVGRGAASVATVADMYATSPAPDPAGQLAAYAAATRSAQQQGYTGFRVAADVTALVSTPAGLDAFARYEQLIDRYICTAPFAAMCGYDASRLDDTTLAQVACLHPSGGDAVAPFRWHADPQADAALSGELDLSTADLFARVLDQRTVEAGSERMIIDATRLGFIDHRALAMLDRFARDRGVDVVMHTRLTSAPRLAAFLDLTAVQVLHVP